MKIHSSFMTVKDFLKNVHLVFMVNFKYISSIVFLWLITIPINIALGQSYTQYNNQQLYDDSGGLFEVDSLRDLYITFINSNYHDTLINSFFNNPSYRLPARISMNGEVFDSVGIRYKGNSTFCIAHNDLGIPKMPYNLDINEWVSGQKLMGRKKIKLANALFDPTFAKEVIAHDIYNKYIPSPEANLIKLHVQGNYLGLYVNIENIDKTFLKKHFDEKNGVLFKCDPNEVYCGSPPSVSGSPTLEFLGNDSAAYFNSYDMKSEGGWAELVRLIDTLNNNFSALSEVLNIDRVLWYFALNTVLANYDTYNYDYIHNYYLYQTKDGLFQIIPWDLSEAFIGSRLEFLIEEQAMFQFDPYEGVYPLEENLFNDSIYRKQYTAHIRTILNEVFDENEIASDVSQLQSLAFDAASNDVFKPFDMNTYTSNVQEAYYFVDFDYAFGGILSTVNGRKNYLLSHPEISSPPPIISTMSISNTHITAEVSNATVVDLMATLSEYNSKFEAFNMTDDGLNGDEVAGDGIFTSPIPFIIDSNEQMKFYIRSQNANAMSLSPERAEYEFFFYSPNEPISIKDDLLDIEIKAYPNPSETFIIVESSTTNPTEYNLYSTNGELMINGTIYKNNQLINISNISSGLYYLNIGSKVVKVLKTQ